MCVLTASVWDAESQCMYIFVIPMEYIYIYIYSLLCQIQKDSEYGQNLKFCKGLWS